MPKLSRLRELSNIAVAEILEVEVVFWKRLNGVVFPKCQSKVIKCAQGRVPDGKGHIDSKSQELTS
jgi:hypothetical protein